MGGKRMSDFAPEFNGRVALVTGGARGIGRACCLRLAAGGARIALNYATNHQAAAETKVLVEAAGGVCELFQADVGDESAFRAAVSSVRNRLGPITLFVANAGITKALGHGELTLEIFRETLRVNLEGVFIGIQQVKSDMLAQGGGSIVCLSSIAAFRPRARQIDYAAAKAGVVAMVRCYAEALAPDIRVNAVAPGLTETDMIGGLDQDLLSSRRAAIPLKRFGQAVEIGEAVAFLLSDRAAFITGHTLVVSGGDVMEP
jgi:3-oxoacyl-[acyl-carrier protein] reductase